MGLPWFFHNSLLGWLDTSYCVSGDFLDVPKETNKCRWKYGQTVKPVVAGKAMKDQVSAVITQMLFSLPKL